MKTFHQAVRQARNGLNFTQKELAEKIGCGQSAISALENGNLGVLSDASISKLCGVLGINRLEADTSMPDEIEREIADQLAYCPNWGCPEAEYENVDGKPAARPLMFSITLGARSIYCRACRSELSRGCPNCLTPLVPNQAFCFGCGHPLVSTPEFLDQQDDVEEWVRRRQERARRYRECAPQIEKLPVPALKNSVPSPVRRE